MPLKRSPLKKGSSSLKQGKGLKKSSIKKKPKTEEQKKEQQDQFEKDVKFYTTEVWDQRPHYCESCEKWLGPEPNLCFFDHLKEKNPFPELRYEPDNIGLVCMSCHSTRTAGFPSERHQQLINKAWERFP